MAARFSQVLYSAQHCNWGWGIGERLERKLNLHLFHENHLEIKNSQNILQRIFRKFKKKKKKKYGLLVANDEKKFFTCFSSLQRLKHVRNYLWWVFRQAGPWWPNWWQLSNTLVNTAKGRYRGLNVKCLIRFHEHFIISLYCCIVYMPWSFIYRN